MGRCKKFTRDHDMFGYPVTLNFNKQGDTWTTSLGGFISLLLKIALFGFFGFKAYRLIFKLDNSISTSVSLTDFKEVGEVSIKDTGFMPYIQLISTKTYEPIQYDFTFDQYF